MTQFPTGPEQVTSEWLSRSLGGSVTGFELEQIGIGVGLLGRLYRVTLQGDGLPESVIAKFPTLDEGARMNVVAPLRFYEKEVRFYQLAGSDKTIPTPAVHFAEFDAETGDFALLMEDVGRCRMADQTTGCLRPDAEVALDAMASLHARWWDGDFSNLSWLPSYSDPPFPQVIAGMYKQAWPRALEVFGDHLSPAYRDYGERYVDLVQWFMDEATREPHTFCHGDFRLDNLFFAGSDDDPAVIVVDWQICFRGRAGYDLGYFLSQSFTTEDRRKHEHAMIARYKQALADHGVDYPDDELDRDYRRTIAYCFIYPIVSAGQVEITNDRHRELIVGMLDRAVAAIEDTDALSLLPTK